MPYEPTYDGFIPQLTDAVQTGVGWGGIEFLYFIVACIILVGLVKFSQGLRG